MVWNSIYLFITPGSLKSHVLSAPIDEEDEKCYYQFFYRVISFEIVAVLQDYFQSKCISWDSSWSKPIRNFMLNEPSFEDGISLLNLCIDTCISIHIPIHNSWVSLHKWLFICILIYNRKQIVKWLIKLF